jgi:hypothetical protein
MQYVILGGSVGDGFMAVGPFTCHEDAVRYAESDVGGYWEILEMVEPEAQAGDD